MFKSLWSGIGVSAVLAMTVGCGLSWGPRDVEDWRVVGGTGTGGGTTGGFGDEQVGGSSTGDVCIPEEEEKCCLEVCAEAVSPVPGGPSGFNCPVAGMPYNCGCDGTDLFDCDDFAHACEEWGRNQGYNICTYVYFWENPDGSQSGHAINIVEFDYPGPLTQFCLIEPQSNTSYGCWVQEPGDPDPPSWVRDAACAAFGGTCTDFEISCDEGHQGDEVCFNTLPAVCSRFRMETGLCPTTFEPDHDCHDQDATGDDCYWDCADDEVCGSACNQCDPAPSGTTGGGNECTGINGNNETCYWDCGALECGAECFECEQPTSDDPVDCSSIDGNNESCFWECEAGTECGWDCYTCW